MIFGNRIADNIGQLGVLLGVPGNKVGKRAQNIIDDLHLTVAADAGANADGGHTHFFSNQGRQRRRDSLQNNAEDPGLFQCPSVFKNSECRLRGLALYPVAAELMN